MEGAVGVYIAIIIVVIVILLLLFWIGFSMYDTIIFYQYDNIEAPKHYFLTSCLGLGKDYLIPDIISGYYMGHFGWFMLFCIFCVSMNEGYKAIVNNKNSLPITDTVK